MRSSMPLVSVVFSEMSERMLNRGKSTTQAADSLVADTFIAS
jgi:hypothetical protein